jgi:hypothetical protein
MWEVGERVKQKSITEKGIGSVIETKRRRTKAVVYAYSLGYVREKS